MDSNKSLYPSSASEDYLLCAAASYFTGAFAYDFYLSERFMPAVRSGAFLIMLICWTAMSFFNGLRLRKRFAAAAVLHHLALPCAAFALENSAFRFSDLNLVVSEFAAVITRFPYSLPEKAFGISGMYFSAITAALCLLTFTAGYIYTKKIIFKSAE